MRTWTKRILTGSGSLVTAMMISNILNLGFNTFLGRHLSFEDFGVLTIINTLWYFINIFLSALVSTITHEVAYLSSKINKAAGTRFFNSIRRNALLISVVVTVVYLLSVPFIRTFFHIANIKLLLLFAPIILAGSIAALNRGYLYGNFFFLALATITLSEALAKLVWAVILVKIDLDDFISLAIPLSIGASAILSTYFVTKLDRETQDTSDYKFPRRFYVASIITGLSTNIFLSLDVTLVKHFLSPLLAGEYAVLALVGKMIYFLGSLVTSFMIAFISRDIGSGRNPQRTFYRMLSLIFGLVLSSTVGFIVFGNIFVPLVFGAKTVKILPYLPVYAVAIGMFTLANAFVTYHLARKQYLFPVLAIFLGLIMAIEIAFHHAGIQDVVNVMAWIAGISLALMMFFHFVQRNGGAVTRNLIDLLFLFLPLPERPPKKSSGKRILVMNWRDMRHVFAGGAEVYIHELAKRWVKQGNKVTLFCGNDGKCPRYEVIDGVEIVRHGGFYFVYIWAMLYYLVKFRGRYDIIIDCENGIPFFSPLYAREKVYLLIHHIHQDVFTRSLTPPLSWLASFLEIRLMPFVYQNIQLITVSPSSKKEIMHYGMTSIEPAIIYNGVDLSVLKPGRKSAKPLILYLGRLKYYKSVHIFIRAAEQVLKAHPDAQFVIAGDGEEQRKLVDLAKKLNISDKITFIGRVSEEQKRELYQRAWVFVNPSFMEGWGITSIEANACGTPVVASDVPGLRDSVKDKSSGFLVPFGQVDRFADKIQLLLDNAELREKMAGQARAWAEKFDWSRSAEDSMKLFNDYES